MMGSVANPIDVRVGGRMRFRRMMLGMSQEKLGVEIGVTFQQIQKYEKGMNRIGASRLYDLARVLGVPVGFFFDGLEGMAEDGAHPRASVTDFVASPEGVALNSAFASIRDSATRKHIVELVKALAQEAVTSAVPPRRIANGD